MRFFPVHVIQRVTDATNGFHSFWGSRNDGSIGRVFEIGLAFLLVFVEAFKPRKGNQWSEKRLDVGHGFHDISRLIAIQEQDGRFGYTRG